MKIQLTALFLIFNCLVISAAQIEEPQIRPAIHVTRSIEQLKAEHTAMIGRYDQLIAKQQAALEKVPEREELRSTHTSIIANAAAKKLVLVREISALDALLKALAYTACIDIGGIRTPQAGCYILSDESHVTINACQKSLPNLWFSHALNFGALLRTFPELRTVLLSRSTPVSCLVSHVGNNIFEDILGKQLEKDYIAMGCSTKGCDENGCVSALYSLQTILESDQLLIDALPEFVTGFAEFLTLFRGGHFTYRSIKRDLPTLVRTGYLRIPTNMQLIPMESYVCMSEGNVYEFMQHAHSQLTDACPHEELFYNILTQVLGLQRTTTQLHLLNGGPAGAYSQTVTFIPREFTGEVDRDKLSKVSIRFLSRRKQFATHATTAA